MIPVGLVHRSYLELRYSDEAPLPQELFPQMKACHLRFIMS